MTTWRRGLRVRAPWRSSAVALPLEGLWLDYGTVLHADGVVVDAAYTGVPVAPNMAPGAAALDVLLGAVAPPYAVTLAGADAMRVGEFAEYWQGVPIATQLTHAAGITVAIAGQYDGLTGFIGVDGGSGTAWRLSDSPTLETGCGVGMQYTDLGATGAWHWYVGSCDPAAGNWNGHVWTPTIGVPFVAVLRYDHVSGDAELRVNGAQVLSWNRAYSALEATGDGNRQLGFVAAAAGWECARFLAWGRRLTTAEVSAAEAVLSARLGL